VIGVLIRRKDQDMGGGGEGDQGRTEVEVSISKSSRETCEETNLADTLISELQPPELQKINFCFLTPPSLWYFFFLRSSR
jgi:hypothetical protein